MAAVLGNRQGQRAGALELELDGFNKNERAVLDVLHRASAPMKIKEIMLANDWQASGNAKGNSRVRNSLRRPVRAGFVQHATEFGDGRYQLTTHGRRSMGPKLTLVPAPVEEISHNPNPQPITRSAVRDMDLLARVKKNDCTLYNACLDQAISGKWAGFSCDGCSAYAEPDAFQKMMNHTRLRALDMAADLLEETGSVCRVRGVKPGADAKRTVRPVETVSLHEALQDSDTEL